MVRFGDSDLIGYVKDIGLNRGGDARARRIQMEKAAVAGALTTGTTWASPIATMDGVREFVALLLRRTVLGMADFVKVPFSAPTPVQSDPAATFWVGEGKPIPVNALAFASKTLEPLKAASIAVLSKDLLRSTAPNASARISDQLASAGAAGLNNAFLDLANSGTAGVKPASITNGIAALTPTGSTPADVAADIGTLIDAADADDVALDRAILVMSPGQAWRAGVGSGTQTCGPRGGSLHGISVFTTREAGTAIILIDTSGILVALGDVDVDTAEHASIEMLTNPTNASADGTATQMVSLWQANSVGLRVLQYANWERTRDNAVYVLDS
jgi:hypothetical protein